MQLLFIVIFINIVMWIVQQAHRAYASLYKEKNFARTGGQLNYKT